MLIMILVSLFAILLLKRVIYIEIQISDIKWPICKSVMMCLN
jgi:hypothetical protein